MAKKKAKKAAAKSAKKPAAKPAPKKAAPKPAPAKKPGASKASGKGGMFPVNTGSGATPVQIGKTIVAMFNEGKMKEIEDLYWAPDIVSCEGMGVGLEWRGRQAVEAKNADWMKDHRIHGASAEGPYVGSSGFAIKFKMDVETISTGQRIVMDEIGVYTVRDGKIAREEFMYGV
ncbi:MAG: nuclear transport factor 2 family protein [Planctomycetota bacterium]|nr:nuclear transport factor 2 family protein [Planctomycetota bacterium]